LDWPLVFKWFSQTVMGVSALHNWKPPIVHRDLKTLNLLVRYFSLNLLFILSLSLFSLCWISEWFCLLIH
jgi:serine/threonine protein kinase